MHAPRAAPRRLRAWLAVAAVGLAAGAPIRPARAAEVVLVVADRLERADVWDCALPHLARLRREAAAGLMCTRFLLSSLPESAYLALGAGAYVQYEGSETWAGGGTAADARACLLATGAPLPAGALYCRERARASLYSNPEAPIGALGQALHAAGKRTACIGNADLPAKPRRQILALLMDGRGVVDAGDVGPATVATDPLAPGGVCVNVPGMLAAFDAAALRADVVALEFGDTSRLAAVRDDLSPQAYCAARSAALTRLDALIGGVRARIDPARTLLVVLTPAPPVAPSPTEQVLTPVFLVGRGWGSGLLTSSTTRRPGLVANADIAATLLQVVTGQPLAQGAGQPLGVKPSSDPGRDLERLDALARRVARLRFRVFAVWALLLAPAVAAGPLLVALRGRHAAASPRLIAGARVLQLAALSLPGGALVAAGLATDSLGQYILSLGGGVALVSVGASALARARPQIPAAAWVAALTVVALLVDAACGSWRILQAMVSYALTEGARFYGIGNEMMGIGVGLALVALMASLPACGPHAPRLAGALSIFLGLAIGCSNVGANFGGALTAAITFGTAASVLSPKRNWRVLALPFASALLVAAALVGIELLRGEDAMSHVGRAAEFAHAGGVPWVVELVMRKAQMNRILIGRTSLTRLFFIAAPLLLAAGLRLPAGVSIGHPGIRPLLVSGAIGSVAAFFLNDSGILAGGLLLAFVTAGAGWLALSERGEA